MQSKDFITETTRIPTGVGKNTVPDVATLASKGDKIVDKYSGSPSGKKDLGRVQEAHSANLSKILRRNKQKFTYLSWLAFHTPPDRMMNGKVRVLTTFVMVARGLVWYKYEGNVPGFGTNHVYVGGQKMKLSSFLKLHPDQQDKLITS